MSISAVQDSGIRQPLGDTGRRENGNEAVPLSQTAPGMDEYLANEPAGVPVKGIYSLGYNAGGNPAVNYTAPHESGPAPASDDGTMDRAASDESRSSSSSSTTTSTDRVDNEIKRLKEQRQLIQQKLRAASDEEEKAELQSRLQQINLQLSQKDNDFYRRQHAVVSQ